MLNSGYRRGMHVSLCVQGKDWEPKDFDVFGAKAIAGIGRLPDTVADRSIAIVLRRRAPGESVARYRYRRAAEEAEPIFDRAATWAAERTPDLQDTEPQVPNELDDRAAEGWEPLLAIADLAGGAWPAKAREAAVALSAGEEREDQSLGTRLLSDIKAVFERGEADNLSSADLVQCLNAMEEAPWGDIRGHALDPRRLAWRLKPFGIRPKQVRIGNLTLKGYSREDFADDWSRYIPSGSETGETSETNESTESASAGVDVSDVSDVSANGGYDEKCLCGRRYTALSPTMRPVCERHRTPEEPCYACGSCLFWAGNDAKWICSRCHPAPRPGDVIEGLTLAARVA